METPPCAVADILRARIAVVLARPSSGTCGWLAGCADLARRMDALTRAVAHVLRARVAVVGTLRAELGEARVVSLVADIRAHVTRSAGIDPARRADTTDDEVLTIAEGTVVAGRTIEALADAALRHAVHVTAAGICPEVADFAPIPHAVPARRRTDLDRVDVVAHLGGDEDAVPVRVDGKSAKRASHARVGRTDRRRGSCHRCSLEEDDRQRVRAEDRIARETDHVCALLPRDVDVTRTIRGDLARTVERPRFEDLLDGQIGLHPEHVVRIKPRNKDLAGAATGTDGDAKCTGQRGPAGTVARVRVDDLRLVAAGGDLQHGIVRIPGDVDVAGGVDGYTSGGLQGIGRCGRFTG